MNIIATSSRQPWNKGKLVGQKTPLRLRDIWAIRVRLQIAERTRDLALFDLAIDSKLRACDLTKLRVHDVAHGDRVSSRAMVMQQKTQRPVQFEITEQTRSALAAWIHQAQLRNEDCLFPSRLHTSDHLSTRQYCGRKIKCHPNYRTLQRSNSCKNPFKTMTYFNSAICKRFVGMEAGIIKVSS